MVIAVKPNESRHAHIGPPVSLRPNETLSRVPCIPPRPGVLAKLALVLDFPDSSTDYLDRAGINAHIPSRHSWKSGHRSVAGDA